jgi:glycosyltransferase involved in cell wall biosynthesis
VTGPVRVAILCNSSLGQIDAIREYSFLLRAALEEKGNVADLVLRDGNGMWKVAGVSGALVPMRRLRTTLAQYDALVLQYNPFMYGKWGFAPWLPADIALLSARRRRVRIVLMVHEPYVPMINWRWTLMGIWQRSQLLALRIPSDVVLASITRWTDRFASRWPSRPTFHLPVGSNLPDMRHFRTEERLRLGVDAQTVVLSTFGTGDPARLPEYIAAAANAVARAGCRVLLLNLGIGAPPLHDLADDVRVETPGVLSAEDVARRLAASDIYLASHHEGISSRRGTMMAALQHGLPVVGTDGRLTDPMLRAEADAIRLVPVGRPEVFAEAAAALAGDPRERQARGRRARELYEQRFDWPVIADRLVTAIAAAAEPQVEPEDDPRRLRPESLR